MAHQQQLDFVKAVKGAFPSFFSGQRVLEIGSLDINGSVRGMFSGGFYIGLDVSEGQGVDVVCQGQEYDAPDGSFDTVVCCEVMEHNPYWKQTTENMIRLCRPGGLLILTCASKGRPEHGTTRTTPADSPMTLGLGWDYYRNLEESDFKAAIDLGKFLSLFRFYRNLDSCDLYMVGFRAGGPVPAKARAEMARFARFYMASVVVYLARQAKKNVLIALVGRKRYEAGPVRFW